MQSSQIKSPISYFGGKHKLIPWIFNHLAAVVPEATWHDQVFIDLFMGGGSISQYAKFQNFKGLLANDYSPRSQLIAQGVVANPGVRLPVDIAFQMALHKAPQATFVQEDFGGSVFSTRHAQKLDWAVSYANQVQDERWQSLLRLLIWRQVNRSVAFATSVGTSNRPFAEALDGRRDFSSLNPKRLRDGSVKGLLEPCWKHLEHDVEELNHCIYPSNSEIQVFQEDVFMLIPRLSGDILYLDPPYPGTLGYNKSNAVLDAVLFGQRPIIQPESPFTKSPAAISDLLAMARHIPTWVLSLNDKVLSLDELMALVKMVAPSRDVQGYSKLYRHLAHVAKRQNQELLVIATERQ